MNFVAKKFYSEIACCDLTFVFFLGPAGATGEAGAAGAAGADGAPGI